jgi:hypothetical protein
MQTNKFVIILSALTALFSGCTTGGTVARVGTDVVAAGAGTVIADKLSNGNPYWTAAGAVAGLALAEGGQALVRNQQQKDLALAYERGKAQNAELAYDAIQNAQKDGRTALIPADADSIEVPITAPARQINGVKINPTAEYIKINNR